MTSELERIVDQVIKAAEKDGLFNKYTSISDDYNYEDLALKNAYKLALACMVMQNSMAYWAHMQPSFIPVFDTAMNLIEQVMVDK